MSDVKAIRFFVEKSVLDIGACSDQSSRILLL